MVAECGGGEVAAPEDVSDLAGVAGAVAVGGARAATRGGRVVGGGGPCRHGLNRRGDAQRPRSGGGVAAGRELAFENIA